MRNEGIGSWPARRARKTPHATAVIYGDRRWTYAQLYGRATRLAHALRGLGVRTGDRVAYLGPNDPSFCETLFATGMIGGIFVPLNMRLAVPELAHCLTDSGSTVLIHAPEQAEAVAEIDRVPRLIPLAGNGDNGYQSLIDGGRPDPIDEPVTLDDPCMIMYTSGTTGRPKGAVLTHGNITWNGVNVLVDIDLAGDEVTLVVAPLFHTAGLNMTCLPTFLKGGAVVLMPSFDPAAVLAAIATHRVTYMFGVPAMYQAMAASAAWPEADLSSLRQLNCGGAPVPMPTIRTYQERGLVFSQGYGMTETAPGALYLTSHASTAKAGTAGVPHFFTDVRVVDHEGNEVDPGEKGEVVVSGPNVMRDYWRRQADTSAVLRDDWLHSGDVATVDDDGFVSIVDRIRDVIISGGENVYPAQVEAVLHEHPSVADCAVIGVPDDTWGEVGRAIVVGVSGSAMTEAELVAFLRGRIAGYKVPKSVVFTGELPRNATGKILRKSLRADYNKD